MRSHQTSQDLRLAEGGPPSSSSRDSSENGVSSRVEACRKRVRMVRANHKGPIETVERGGISVASSVEGGTEMSRGSGVIEVRAERLDEAGIT